MRQPPPVALILVIVLCLLANSNGWAASSPLPPKTPPCDDIPECRDHLTKAYRATQSEKYTEALPHYVPANQISPSATLMFHKEIS